MRNTSKYQKKIRISQMLSSILTVMIVFFYAIYDGWNEDFRDTPVIYHCDANAI